MRDKAIGEAERELASVFARRDDTFSRQLSAKMIQLAGTRGGLDKSALEILAEFVGQEMRIRAAAARSLFLKAMLAAKYTPTEEEVSAVSSKFRVVVEESLEELFERLMADPEVGKDECWPDLARQIRTSTDRAIFEAESSMRNFPSAVSISAPGGTKLGKMNLEPDCVGIVHAIMGGAEDVNFDEANKMALIAGLEEMRMAVLAVEEFGNIDKEMVLALIGAASAEAAKIQPDKAKLAKLLNGIGNGAAFAAALEPSWNVVKDAATILYGIN